jgi:hypothetical protein
MICIVKYGKGTNEKRQDKEKQERNKLKKEWIGKEQTEKESSSFVTSQTLIDLLRIHLIVSSKIFQVVFEEETELCLTKKEIMKEGKTKERKTGTKQKLRGKRVKQRTNEDLSSKHMKE